MKALNVSPRFRRFLDRITPPPRRHLLLPSAFQRAEGGRWLPQQWVIARALLRFQAFDLEKIPPGQRGAALATQVVAWAPFARSGHAVVWRGAIAQVWAWDAAELGSRMGGAAVPAIWCPETLLQAPMDEGVRLIQCQAGCEGQVWLGGALRYSRWWRAAPAEADWLSFLRAAALAPDMLQRHAAVPEPLALPLLPSPWASPGDAQTYQTFRERLEAWVYPVGVIALLVPAVWYAAKLMHWREAAEQQRVRLAELKKAAEPNLVARDKALNSAEQAQSLAQLLLRPDQLDLMMRVAKVLPGGTVMTEWNYQPDRLRVGLSFTGNEPSSALLIEGLQNAERFTGIRAVQSVPGKAVTLEMQVRPAELAKLTTGNPVMAGDSAPAAASPAATAAPSATSGTPAAPPTVTPAPVATTASAVVASPPPPPAPKAPQGVDAKAAPAAVPKPPLPAASAPVKPPPLPANMPTMEEIAAAVGGGTVVVIPPKPNNPPTKP